MSKYPMIISAHQLVAFLAIKPEVIEQVGLTVPDGNPDNALNVQLAGYGTSEAATDVKAYLETLGFKVLDEKSDNPVYYIRDVDTITAVYGFTQAISAHYAEELTEDEKTYLEATGVELADYLGDHEDYHSGYIEVVLDVLTAYLEKDWRDSSYIVKTITGHHRHTTLGIDVGQGRIFQIDMDYINGGVRLTDEQGTILWDVTDLERPVNGHYYEVTNIEMDAEGYLHFWFREPQGYFYVCYQLETYSIAVQKITHEEYNRMNANQE